MRPSLVVISPPPLRKFTDLFDIAEDIGIPFYVWSIAPDKSNREEVEREEMELLERERVTFIVLARYMQVISDGMIARYPHNIINIHHSFLPAFVGARPYHQAYERGVKIIGATSHYVTRELDAGPGTNWQNYGHPFGCRQDSCFAAIVNFFNIFSDYWTIRKGYYSFYL